MTEPVTLLSSDEAMKLEILLSRNDESKSLTKALLKSEKTISALRDIAERDAIKIEELENQITELEAIISELKSEQALI